MQRIFALIVVLCIIFLIMGCFSTLPNIELEPITEPKDVRSDTEPGSESSTVDETIETELIDINNKFESADLSQAESLKTEQQMNELDTEREAESEEKPTPLTPAEEPEDTETLSPKPPSHGTEAVGPESPQKAEPSVMEPSVEELPTTKTSETDELTDRSYPEEENKTQIGKSEIITVSLPPVPELVEESRSASSTYDFAEDRSEAIEGYKVLRKYRLWTLVLWIAAAVITAGSAAFVLIIPEYRKALFLFFTEVKKKLFQKNLDMDGVSLDKEISPSEIQVTKTIPISILHDYRAEFLGMFFRLYEMACDKELPCPLGENREFLQWYFNLSGKKMIFVEFSQEELEENENHFPGVIPQAQEESYYQAVKLLVLLLAVYGFVLDREWDFLRRISRYSPEAKVLINELFQQYSIKTHKEGDLAPEEARNKSKPLLDTISLFIKNENQGYSQQTAAASFNRDIVNEIQRIKASLQDILL